MTCTYCDHIHLKSDFCGVVTRPEGRDATCDCWIPQWLNIRIALGDPCDCFTGAAGHAFGLDPDCEFFQHHCETCHQYKTCTTKQCGLFAATLG